MNSRYSAPFQRLFQRKIEIRGIDTNKYIRWIGLQASFDIAANTGNLAIMLENLYLASISELLKRVPLLIPLPKHFRAANAVKPGIRQFLFKCLNQVAGQQIARRFSRHHGNTYNA